MNNGFKTIEGGGMWGGRLLLFDSLGSTNRWAMDNAGTCRNGDVISAMIQTAGTGRFARTWASPDRRGLAISAILRPPLVRAGLIHATGFAAALAVRNTLAGHGIDAMLKWPNDVMVNDRKISGILAEMDSASETIVLGIGLNVNVTEDDLRAAALADTATSMRIDRKQEFDMDGVLRQLIARLQDTFDRVADKGFDWITGEWKRHDWLTGHVIDIHGVNGPVNGRYAGMDSAGALCLFDPAGTRQLFSAGDVVRLRKAQ